MKTLKTLDNPKKLAKTDMPIVVSYPKSGRTWLKCLIGCCYASPISGLDGLRKVVKNAKRIFNFTHGRPFSDSFHPSTYDGNKIVFLERDVKDTIVSLYFHMTWRPHDDMQLYEGSLSDFIRHKTFGAQRIINFNHKWLSYFNNNPSFLHITYEDLSKNTHKTLTTVLQFCNRIEFDTVVDDAVKYCDFDNMKKLAASSTYGILKPTHKNKESHKIRNGQVGGHVDYLSEADIAYIDSLYP